MSTSPQDTQNEENIPLESPTMATLPQDTQNEENIPIESSTMATLPQDTQNEEKIHEMNDKKLVEYLPLYRAAFDGNWENAKTIFQKDPSAAFASISKSLKTALHIAAGSGHTLFVKKLVKRMSEEALEMQTNKGETALHFAVVAGDIEAGRAMVNKNSNLPNIPTYDERTPILQAAILCKREFFLYLYDEVVYQDLSQFEGEDGVRLLNALIDARFYDIALRFVKDYPELATSRDQIGDFALNFLSRRPSTFKSGSNLGFWHSCIYPMVHINQISYTLKHQRRGDTEDPPTQDSRESTEMTSQGVLIGLLQSVIKFLVPQYKEIYDTKMMHIYAEKLVKAICNEVSSLPSHSKMMTLVKMPFVNAAKYGTVEIIAICLQYFPRLIVVTDNKYTILHIAIRHRQEHVFNLLRKNHAYSCTQTLANSQILEEGNNTLHLAAKSAMPQKLKAVPGSALQMQKEFQWYKAVENILQPTYKDLTNNTEKTPRVLFTEEHAELAEKGETWMKERATSCSVVATLISTVVFTAAFTVPGGNGDNGIPIFLENKYFTVFVVSDALGLIFSLTSLLVFLSMLVSRYAEEDFLVSLPRKFMTGLATLFLSILAMLIAFASTCVVMFGTRSAWITLLIASTVCLPTVLFACQYIRLFYELYRSTYLCNIL